jgi:hypothetical protein
LGGKNRLASARFPDHENNQSEIIPAKNQRGAEDAKSEIINRKLEITL